MPSFEQFFSIATTYSALAAFIVAAYIYYSNPARSINYFLATAVAAGGVWQSGVALFFAGSSSVMPARIGLSALALFFMAGRLSIDAAQHPFSPIIERFQRTWTWAIYSITIGVVPLSELWLRATSTTTQLDVGPLFIPMRIAWITGCLLLGAIAFNSRRTSVAHSQFEMLNLTAMFVLGAVVTIVMAMAGYALPHFRAHIPSFFIIYFAWTAWLMTTRRIFSFSSLTITASIHVISIATNVLMLIALFTLSRFLFERASNVLIIISSCGAVYIISSRINSRMHRFFFSTIDTPYSISAYRTTAVEILSQTWNESALTRSFIRLIAQALLAPTVEIGIIDRMTQGTSSAGRRELLDYARHHGWLTPQLAARVYGNKEAVKIIQLFDRENLTLVCATGERGNETILFAGYRHGSRFTTYAEAEFMRELMGLYRGGCDRIRLAAKATHADRLATVGLLSAQFRSEGRNRLETIRAAIELVKDGRASDISVEHRRILLQEIDDFIAGFNLSLDMSRPDIGDLREVDVQLVVQEVCQSLAPIAARRRVVVEHHLEPALVKADHRLLRQALLNLLRSMVESLNETPEPKITLTSTNNINRFQIDIRDNGPGVSNAMHDHLFRSFSENVDSHTALGLAICRDAMLLMNGSISYMTPKDQPSTWFRVTLETARSDLVLEATYPIQN